MEVLASRSFVDRVRAAPRDCRRWLARTIASAPVLDVACAEQLGGEWLVGWTRERDRLKLWYLVEGEPAAAEFGAPPLAALSRAELRELGVPDETITAVHRVETLAQLAELGLDDVANQRLRFLFLQTKSGLGEVAEPLVRRATDLSHLERFLRGEITELLLHLDATQRQIVQLGGTGPVAVRGVAGSGKTAVALHRIYEQLRQRSLIACPRVLLLTYNRSLAGMASELLRALGLRPGDVEVFTVHAFCRRCIGSRQPILEEDQRRELILEARNEVRDRSRRSALWSYPNAFWQDEIHLLQGRVLGDAQAYFDLRRFGAGRPLDRHLRELVWEVYSAYRRRCAQSGAIDWDDLVRLAFEQLRSGLDEAQRYDHVVVDEAQDLTAVGLRLAASLVRANGSLFVAYDPAQSIYEHGLSWRDCGVELHGSRSFDLTRNQRNTVEILEAARPLLRSIDGDRRGEEDAADETPLRPEHAERHGPAPRLLPSRRGEECRATAADIRRAIEHEGVRPQNIAVLCYPNETRDRMASALAEVGVLHQLHSQQSEVRLRDPSVKVLPVKSAKGLEFPVVYLLASGRWFRPPFRIGASAERDAWLAEMRRVFYMAMTRAMARLVLVYDRRDPTSMIEHLL